MRRLKKSTISGLSKSSVLIGTHLHSNRLKYLLNPHVAIPVPHRRNLASRDIAIFIDASHVDFRNKADIRRNGRVFVGAMNSELIEAICVVCLQREEWIRRAWVEKWVLETDHSNINQKSPYPNWTQNASIPIRQKCISRIHQTKGNWHVTMSLFALLQLF